MIMLQNLQTKNLQSLQVLLCAANQIRTDTPVVWALPPQGSASTNFAIAAGSLTGLRYSFPIPDL